MKHWFKNLRKPTQVVLILGLFALLTVAAYAAFSKLSVTESNKSTMTKEKFVSAVINVTPLSGTIAPGESKDITAVVTNTGTADGLGYIRFEYPVVSNKAGAEGSLYTWTVNDGWSVVEQGVGYTVYGYSDMLGEDGSTSSLTDKITMKNVSIETYKSLTDVNISMIGYVADKEEYGDDIKVAWEAAN